MGKKRSSRVETPAAASEPTVEDLAAWRSASDYQRELLPYAADWLSLFASIQDDWANRPPDGAPPAIAALVALHCIVGGWHKQGQILPGDYVQPPDVADDDPFAGRNPYALIPIPYWVAVELATVWARVQASSANPDLNQIFDAHAGGKQGARGFLARTINTAWQKKAAAEVHNLIRSGSTATRAYATVAKRWNRTGSWVKAADLRWRGWVEDRFGDPKQS